MDTAKKELRRRMLALRRSLSEKERHEMSMQIRKELLSRREIQEAENILCYANYGQEVETLPFLADCLLLGKQVYCPLVIGKEMEFYRISSVDELQEGFHGIPEPLRDEARLYFPQKGSQKDVMIMPGVVFDLSYHRIGYGGGYYDRYLSRIKNLYTVAVAFSHQIVDEIPFEEYDICPQIVLTEKGEIRKQS